MCAAQHHLNSCDRPSGLRVGGRRMYSTFLPARLVTCGLHNIEKWKRSGGYYTSYRFFFVKKCLQSVWLVKRTKIMQFLEVCHGWWWVDDVIIRVTITIVELILQYSTSKQQAYYHHLSIDKQPKQEKTHAHIYSHEKKKKKQTKKRRNRTVCVEKWTSSSAAKKNQVSIDGKLEVRPKRRSPTPPSSLSSSSSLSSRLLQSTLPSVDPSMSPSTSNAF